MKLIDTHAHLFAKAFFEDREAMVARAATVCEAIFLPNIDADTVSAMNALADAHPNLCYPMLGLHPTHVPEAYQQVLDGLDRAFEQRTYWGVGETGIDLHWDTTTLQRQQESLAWHCEQAKARDLPLILHARNAFWEVADVVAAHQDGSLRGIFHCFTEGEVEAKRALDLGFHLGIGGVLTFKKSGLADVLSGVNRSRVVLETDAPYLAPMPYRGKRNETAYLAYIADRLAEAWQTDRDTVAATTTQNARTLFRLPSAELN